MKVTNNKSMTAVAILTALLAGCNSESSTQAATPVEHTEHPQEKSTTESATPDPVITPTEPITEPVNPIVELTPIDPAKPVVTPAPKPATPVFVPEGISTITQQPYSGTVIRGGDAYLRYDSGVADFQDFELPEWTVTYRYELFLEVLITNGTETLCARYSWKKGGFGYAKPHCLWSDTRQAVPIDDMKNAYYGYSVVESRVWVNGVVGLGVEVEQRCDP